MSNELESLEARRRFLLRCFPSVLLGILLGCFSMADMLLIARMTWAEVLPFSLMPFLPRFTVVLMMVSSLGTVAFIYGWPRGVWAVVGMFLICLLVVAPTFTFDLPRGLYVSGVLAPLLGLLVVNSKRHREYRQGCEWIRHRFRGKGRLSSGLQRVDMKRMARAKRRENNRRRKRLDDKFR